MFRKLFFCRDLVEFFHDLLELGIVFDVDEFEFLFGDLLVAVDVDVVGVVVGDECDVFLAFEALLIDLGRPMQLDELCLDFQNEYDLSPLRTAEGMTVRASSDLASWHSVVALADKRMRIDMRGMGAVRYVKLPVCPLRISEVYGLKDGKPVDRTGWRANNLFRDYNRAGATARQAWQSTFTLGTIPPGSYLCIAIPGECGNEGAWAAVKVDGQYVGCPDRAPSFMSNTWECPVRRTSHDYTYYLPLTPDMSGKTIQAWALAFGTQQLQPEVWVTAYPIPFEKKNVKL